MRTLFRRRRAGVPRARGTRGTKHPQQRSSDLSDVQLDRISGGVSYFHRHQGPAYGGFRPELPILAARPSDDPDLWF